MATTSATVSSAGCCPNRGYAGRAGSGMLRVEEFERLLVDLHVLAIGDGRRLGRAHEMAPAPRKAGGVEFLESRLMVLEGVHLGEVIMHDNRGQTADERIRVVPEFGILLGQIHGVLHLGHS